MSKTANASERDMLMERLREWCGRQPLQLCVLFGSQATGQVHPESDVDLAIWPDEAPAPEQKLRWIGELESLVGSDVSLVLVSPDLDPVLGMEIVRHGVVIYEAVPEEWYERRLDLWHAYNDALPFLRAQWETVGNFARKVLDGT
jgi:predicted nucleotidyltransferase